MYLRGDRARESAKHLKRGSEFSMGLDAGSGQAVYIHRQTWKHDFSFNLPLAYYTQIGQTYHSQSHPTHGHGHGRELAGLD